MKNDDNIHYVYQLRDPRKDLPFYVGMGKDRRAWDHEKDAKTKVKNSHKINTIRRIKLDGFYILTEMITNNLSRKDAITLEIFYIAKYGRADLGLGPLTNLTNGGDGIRSEDARKLATENWKTPERRKRDAEIKSNPDYIKAMRDNTTKRFHDPEYRAAHVEAMNRPEVKLKLSLTGKAYWDTVNDEQRAAHGKLISDKNKLWKNGRVTQDNIKLWAKADILEQLINGGQRSPKKLAAAIGYEEPKFTDVCTNIRNAIDKGWSPLSDQSWVSDFKT